jgi:antitoxin component of MazEF toxin-antitoxin module
MPYPTTVQLIQRRRSQQWYVNFPAAVANALDFSKGETVEWTVLDRRRLLLTRRRVPKAPAITPSKKTASPMSHD